MSNKWRGLHGPITAAAAERAADRQITAADRAGKAVDANITKAGTLAGAYNSVAPAAEGKGQPATAARATPAAAAGDPQSVLSALDAIRAAVDSAAARIVSAEQGTTNAVRSSGGKFAS